MRSDRPSRAGDWGLSAAEGRRGGTYSNFRMFELDRSPRAGSPRCSLTPEAVSIERPAHWPPPFGARRPSKR